MPRLLLSASSWRANTEPSLSWNFVRHTMSMTSHQHFQSYLMLMHLLMLHQVRQVTGYNTIHWDFYLDVKADAVCLAHLEEHAVVHLREVGMKEPAAHHCKTTCWWRWLIRHEHKRKKYSTSSLILLVVLITHHVSNTSCCRYVWTMRY